MSKRIAKKAVPGADYTRDEATALAASVVASQIQRERLVAERDAAIETAARPYRPAIDQADAEIKDGLARLEAWASAHPEEFGSAESTVLPGGHRVGWRLGNWAAKAMKGYTWARVQTELEALPAKWRAYLRIKAEVDKSKILADRDVYDWRAVGVEFAQERRFYLDPHREG
jgi:phage host-nuclease inhibitor protein Gam